MKTPTVTHHDAANPDNCSPRCKQCAAATRDENRGGRSTVTAVQPSTKPSWWTCTLACGHVIQKQKSGQHAPKVGHCCDPKCKGNVIS